MVELLQCIEYQLFCSDVDTTRRFGDKKEFRIQSKSFSQTDFLLVAAGEFLCFLLGPGAFDSQFVNILLGDITNAFSSLHLISPPR